MLTPRFPGFLRQMVVAWGVLLVGLSPAVAQVAVSTLAGSSPAIASGNVNATGTAARFNALASVAVDAAGNIYVADANNHTIRKVTAAGVVTTLAGSGAAGNANGTGAAASFRFPQGVATDNTNVYVADTFNHAIRKIVINTGVVTTLAGTVGTSGTTNALNVYAQFNNPLGLAVSGTDLYVADTSNHTIRKIAIGTGLVTTFTGTAGTPGFADGTGVAATFKNPGAIAAEGTTNLYVADTANHIIRKIVIGTAAVTTLAGTGNGTGGSTDSTGAAASFKSPGGLVVSGVNLFVADTGNNILRQIVHATGVVTTIAGTAGLIGNTDAISTAARFQGPTGIGVSAGGNLYIADTNNHTLRTAGAAVSNPAAATVTVGANATFTVTTTGNPTPTIQWERQPANTVGFTAIATSVTYTGVGTATLTVTNATLAMTGDQFRASVTNGVGGAVVSAVPAVLTVQLAPTITSAAATNFSVNTAGTFTVTATGSPAPTFSVVAGSFPPWATLDATTGVISGTPTNNTGAPFNFTIRASNGVNPVSDQAFVLTVVAISMNVSGRLQIALGGSQELAATAALAGPLAYHWRKNGQPIFGATSATYVVADATVRSAGVYQVVVTNSAGPQFGPAVFVTVSVPTQVRAWGLNTSGQTTVPAGLTNAISVAAGSAHTLALKADGTLVAWGDNTSGQATIPSGLNGVVAIAASGFYNMALKGDGTVVTWGGGINYTPLGLSNVVAIAAGGGAMALRADGTLVLWDAGNILTTTPAGPDGVVAIAAGPGGHDLTAKIDGSVVAWGSNGFGQATVPASLTSVTALAAGLSHSLALRSDGTVVAWGRNNNGQSSVPAGLGGVVAIAASFETSFALRNDGAVVAWGSDINGAKSLPSGLANTFMIAGGDHHALAVRAADVPPTVITSPANKIVAAGQSATFTVTAAGVPTPSFQWRFNGAAISGATNPSYTFVAQSSNTGNYDVVLSNYLGTATSTPAASLLVGTAPLIASQPIGQSVGPGGTVQLAVSTNGTSPFTYQWRKNSTTVPGATSSLLVLSNFQSSDAGSYDVVVTNAIGSAISGSALLTLATTGLSPPVILSQPIGGTIFAGNVAAFFVTASGPAPIYYQWRKDGVAIADATSANLIQANSQVSASGAYAVVVSNVSGSVVSTSASLLVVPNPGFVNHPSSQTVGLGGTVVLTSRAIGDLPLTYQWNKDTTPLAGATDASLRVSNFQSANAGAYVVVATNTTGTATSNAAALTEAVGSGTPPAITNQPIGGTIFAGNVAAFFVNASGPAPIYYQWRKDGLPISGATSASFIQANTQMSASGAYDVVVSNLSGSVVSTSTSLLVVPNPGFVLHPVSQTVLGGPVILIARAIGDLPLTYQWRKNSEPLSGKTTSSLSLPNVQSSDLASYDVVVTNSVGSATSSAAALTLAGGVTDIPVITSQPDGATLNLTNQGSFRVSATSSTSLFYQWRKDGSALAGETNSVLALGAVTAASAGSFDVVVTNLVGTVTSAAVVLTINPPVVFNSQPLSVSTFVGLGVTFSASATGFPGTPTYQWRKDTVAITGATASELTIASAQLADAGSYDVIATASAGSATSNAATLAVTDSAPQITAQPTGATLAVGGNTTLAVAATGSAPLTYQWRRDGTPIFGATTTSFVIVNAQTYQSGLYDVIVTNSLGSVPSAGARINVIPRVIAYSARLQIDPDGAVAVFTIEGTLPKRVLLRAVGPGLATFGFSGLPDPQLELFNSVGTLIALNNDWSSSPDAAAISTTTAAVGAFILGVGSRDSAVLATLAPGTYTVRAKPASGVGGTGYLELYDADLGTGPLSTLPYVAVRGRMGAGGGVVIGGLGSNGRGQRSYLVRAIGPALGLPGAHANPAMLVVRDGTLVGSNDDWDTNATGAAATTAATARVAAFSLPAGGRDAALVLTGNLHASACTVQVGGSDALGGTVLLELHDLDAVRPVTFAPAIVSAPVSTTVASGEAATLRVLAHGTAPLTYQWRKEGIPLDGATTATLSLAAVQPSQGGSYTVFVTNSLGAATSLSAVLTVQSGGSGSAATQAVVGSGYAAGAIATITNTLTYTATATGLGWKVTLPLGWSFVSDAGMVGDVRPVVGTVGALEWAWTVPPIGPVTFTYTVRVPAGTAGDQFLAASGIVRFDGSLSQPIATPSPLLVSQITTHSADTDADFRIGLVELTRVIELYNARIGTTRTGRYLIQDGSEDGYALDRVTPAGAPVTLTRFHSADSNRNADISLVELTRVIELYNVRAGTSRTGAYRVLAGTEDGFTLGP